MSTGITIYILKLRENKFYVGKTTNPVNRIKQHCEGNGSFWTQMYPPIGIEAIFKDRSPFEEDRYVKEYMSKYGMDSVRGGAYSSMYLTEEQKFFITQELLSIENRCYSCGSIGHYANQCFRSLCSDTDDWSEVKG
jgi:predicted GIY-YIG superfamily endonuclease